MSVQIYGNHIFKLLNFFLYFSGSDAITILAGSKCDLKDERQVEETEIKVCL